MYVGWVLTKQGATTQTRDVSTNFTMYNPFAKYFKPDVNIAMAMRNMLDRGARNLHIFIYIKDQILFQVMPAKNFKDDGFETENPNAFVELHFFNKNKTLTLSTHSKFKDSGFGNAYFHFERTKNHFSYIKEVGSNPDEIETIILERIKVLYEHSTLTDISFDFSDY